MDTTTLLNEIRREEGKVLNDAGLHILYFDHLGNPTMGYGMLVNEQGGMPEHIAQAWLEWTVQRVIEQMDDSMLWWRGESRLRKHALVNMAFQLGVNGLLRFKKMLWQMQHGNYKEAYKEALDSHWAKQTPERAMRIAKMIRDGYSE